MILSWCDKQQWNLISASEWQIGQVFKPLKCTSISLILFLKKVLFLEEHKATGNPVMESLAVIGKSYHEESEEKYQGGNKFCKMAQGNTCERGLAPLKVGYYHTQQHFARCCLAA